MISVTPLAKDKMKTALQARKDDETTLIRLARSSDDPQKLGFTLDTEKRGDQVIRDNKGEKLLLIGEDIGPTLVGLVLDYRYSGQRMCFTISHS